MVLLNALSYCINFLVVKFKFIFFHTVLDIYKYSVYTMNIGV